MHNYQDVNHKETQRAKLLGLLETGPLPLPWDHRSVGCWGGCWRWGTSSGPSCDFSPPWWGAANPAAVPVPGCIPSAADGVGSNGDPKILLRPPCGPCATCQRMMQRDTEPGGSISGLEDALEKTALKGS